MGASSHGKIATAGHHFHPSFVIDASSITGGTGIPLAASPTPSLNGGQYATPRLYRVVIHSIWAQVDDPDHEIQIYDRIPTMVGANVLLTGIIDGNGVPFEFSGSLKAAPGQHPYIVNTATAGGGGTLNVGVEYLPATMVAVTIENEAGAVPAVGTILTAGTSGWRVVLVDDRPQTARSSGTVSYMCSPLDTYVPGAAKVTPARGEQLSDGGGWTADIVGVAQRSA